MLGGIADTVAQIISVWKLRKVSQNQESSGDFLSIEIHELDKEKPPVLGELGFAKGHVPTFDFERLTRFMAYGFFMAPIQFQWFKFLSQAFPITKASANVPVLKRVAVDQLIFAPISTNYRPYRHNTSKITKLIPGIGLGCFFTFMTIAEGGGRRATVRKFQDVYLRTLMANYILWPVVQLLNFRVVPIQFQIVSRAHQKIAGTLLISSSLLSLVLVLRGRLTSLWLIRVTRMEFGKV